MKKTFTLLAIAALLTSASFAQNHHERHDNYENNDEYEIAANNNREGHGYGRERGKYYFSAREKNMQIASINREYNWKIESIKHKFFMGRSKKERLICSLELQRDAEISSVIAKFNSWRNRFDPGDNRHYDYDKKNNW